MIAPSSVQAPHRGPAVLAAVLFAVAGAFALSVDVPRTGYGIKSDEATYVAMALSLAHDGNLSFERRDLERFAGLYHSGPEGIFLKRGAQLRVRSSSTFPFVRLVTQPDPDTTRVYFAKAQIYPLFAAPFVRLFGLNGILLFNVVMLAGVAVCAYLFLVAQQSSPAAAVAFTTAFLGAAALSVYGVFLMPEIFNVALVFAAYFLWLYKYVNPHSRLARGWTDVAAAMLLGMATYSKPLPNVFLVAPLVAYAWWQRRWIAGFALGTAAVAVAALLFGLTAAVSGEFNYQGGYDRRTFHSDGRPPEFPFDSPSSTWDSFPTREVATDGTAAVGVLRNPRAPGWFVQNLGYFFVGRHFGFVPYYFPGVLAIALWMLSPARRDPWRLLIVAAFGAATVVLLLILPFTWSGGGGPPGNRYMVSAYGVLFFVVPRLTSVVPGVMAWSIGALFTAKMLMTPFVAAKYTYLTTETGLARRLPVELSMAADLPVMLDGTRGRIPYGPPPQMLLYFLDQNAFAPEPAGMWVSGGGRADIIVRSVDPIERLTVDAESPIRTILTVSMGSDAVSVPIEPGQVVRFEVPASGVPDFQSHAYLLQAHSSEGFVPRLMDPQSRDYRNLGAQMRFSAITKSPAP